MKKSICKNFLEVMPKVTEFTDLRSTYIANCVFNTFLSYTVIMLNIVTIHAIRKASSLSKTLNTLLLSLAISDLGVGFLGQPVYTSILVKLLQNKTLTATPFGVLYSFPVCFISPLSWVCWP